VLHQFLSAEMIQAPKEGILLKFLSTLFFTHWRTLLESQSYVNFRDSCILRYGSYPIKQVAARHSMLDFKCPQSLKDLDRCTSTQVHIWRQDRSMQSAQLFMAVFWPLSSLKSTSPIYRSNYHLSTLALLITESGTEMMNLKSLQAPARLPTPAVSL
jgi:hypothetical protein